MGDTFSYVEENAAKVTNTHEGDDGGPLRERPWTTIRLLGMPATAHPRKLFGRFVSRDLK